MMPSRRDTALLAICGLLSGCAPAWALSVHEAAMLALQNDPRLASAESGMRSSAAGIEAARAGYRPSADLSLGGTWQRYSFDHPPGDASLPLPSELTPVSVGIHASQPLYTGGLTGAHIESAQAQLDAAGQRVTATRQALLLETATAYLDVVRDRAIVELQNSNLATLQQASDDTQKRFDAGEATRTDIAQAAARLAEGRADLRRAQTAVSVSEAAFVRVVGAPPDGLDAGWPRPDVPATLDEALALIGGSPPVLSADARGRAAAAEVSAARAAALPKLSLNASANEQNDSEFELDSYKTWAVSLKATLPLYQGGAVRAQLAAAHADVAQAGADAADARRAGTEAVTQAWAELQAADEVIHAYEAAVDASRSALDAVAKELDAGTRTTLDLLDAERDRLAAEVSLAASRRDRTVAAYRLLQACGRLGLDDIR